MMKSGECRVDGLAEKRGLSDWVGVVCCPMLGSDQRLLESFQGIKENEIADLKCPEV